MIDKTRKVPLYLQLMRVLMSKIDNQSFREHEKLPSERELCEIYNVSRITVRQALQELEREGYIYKLHGKGTFVAAQTYNQKLDALYSFTEEMKKLGKVPSATVLNFQEVESDEHLANKMGLSKNAPVYQLIRLRLADGEPLMYETTYLPVYLFPNLSSEDLKERPLYEVLQRNYEKTVTNATERFSATLLREEEAAYLEANIDQPAMFIKRFAYHYEQLIEYTSSVARGDKFAYTVELK